MHHGEAEGWDALITGERSFDHYARLVRRLLDVPTALVTIIEKHRQVFPGVVGLPEPYLSARQTPLSHSFCQYVVRDQRPLIIRDAREDPLVAQNPAIRDLNVIAYAGWPLVGESDRIIGSLCAIDSVPREWTAAQLDLLKDLASACSAELQQSGRAVKDGEGLARSIFAAADVALAFYDTEGRLLLANDLAERAAAAAGFRLDIPPHAGIHVRRADNCTSIPLDEQIIPRGLRGESTAQHPEWFGQPGNQMALLGSSRKVLRDDGTAWGTLIAAHDVTDLARSLQVRDEFITTVSHELRTPLTSILGYLEVLGDELDGADGRVPHTLRVIERSALRLQERIEELLDAGDRRRHLDLRSIDISLITHRSVATFADEAVAGELELSVDAVQAQWAVADAARVQQALEQLLSNALKFTPGPGHVRVTVRGEDTTVKIVVSDSGVGMSPDEVAQAFDSFWRAHSSYEGAVPGVGLGLTRVREILQEHSGSVEIESHPGKGTTITATLPRNCTA